MKKLAKDRLVDLSTPEYALEGSNPAPAGTRRKCWLGQTLRLVEKRGKDENGKNTLKNVKMVKIPFT